MLLKNSLRALYRNINILIAIYLFIPIHNLIGNISSKRMKVKKEQRHWMIYTKCQL